MDANTDVTPGFYNCVNAGLYYASNFVPRAANERAMDYIVLCLNQLWETGRFGSFFYEKTADQWLEPWFGGLTMNNPSIFEDPSGWQRPSPAKRCLCRCTPGSVC